MKLKDYIIIALVLICAIFLLKEGCDSNPEKVTTKTDTLWLPSKDVIHNLPVFLKIPEPYRVDSFIYVDVPSKVDTAKILADYFRKRFYADSTKNDSVTVYYKAEVSQNKLKDIKLSYRLTLPTMVISKSTTVTTNRQLAFIGADLIGNQNTFGFAPSIYFDTKKAMLGGGYDLIRKEYKVGVYGKIKLWKRK